MVTRKDVAALAGVNVTAVSRAITGNGYVAKAKKEAVLGAAKALGYRAEPPAAKKRSGKHIMYYCKDLDNAFNIELYRGMLSYASQYDYMVVLSGTWDLEKLRSIPVDGVVLPNETVTDAYVNACHNAMTVPAVSASYGEYTRRPKGIPFIEADTHVAMDTLLDYLQSKGHRKIALATPYPVTIENPRSTAFRNRLLPVHGDRINDYVFVLDYSAPHFRCDEEDFFFYGEQLAQLIYDRHTDATAIACFNDNLAIGMIHHFHRLGLKIPEDFSVAGIDGLRIGRYIFPKLTSVAISPFEQGRECIRALLELIADQKVKGRISIPQYLIEGESVRDLRHTSSI